MFEPHAYYHRPWKTWVLYWVDLDGNQVWDAEYISSKQDLQAALAVKNA